jgi:Mg2+ and Co2+ transporter CorA
MPAHQYQDGNDGSTAQVPSIEIDLASSFDDLHDRLQPQTIQWDGDLERSPNLPPRRLSTSTTRHQRDASRGDCINPDDRRASHIDDSESDRDLALASPTLPPSAMPSVFSDNRSFQDLELPLPGISERPGENSDAISFLSSSGSSSESISPEEPHGEDFIRRHHHHRYHRGRSTANGRSHPDARAFNTLLHPTTAEKDHRPTVIELHPRRATQSDARSRSGTVSSVVLDDADSNEDNSEKAEEDVCFPMADDELRDSRGIDFEEMEEFAREMRELLGRLDLTDEQRYAVQPRHANPIRHHRSGSRVSTVDDKREVSTALHHHPAFNPKFERNSSNDSVEDEKIEALLPKLSRVPTAGSVARPIGQRYPCRGDRKHDRFIFFTPGMEETISAEEFCDLVQPGETYSELFDQTKGTWWLDVLNPSVEEMKMLSKAFKIHPLTNEDIRTQESREKVELFRTYYFVCFRSFENDVESEDYLKAANMYIVVFRGGLLTFHFTNTPHAANVRRRIRQLRDYVSVSSDWVCYALIDDITDAFGPLVSIVEGETEAIDDAVMIARVDETRNMLTRISLLRKKILGMLKLLGGKADVIKMFAKRCNEQWDVAPTGEIGLYLGDIQGILPCSNGNLISQITSLP